jgi:hypothetical protein
LFLSFILLKEGTLMIISYIKPIRNRKMLISTILFLIFFITVSPAADRSRQMIYLQGFTSDYIDYLTNSGKINSRFVFQQPYGVSLLDSLNEKSRFSDYFLKYWNLFYQDNAITANVELSDKVKYQEDVFRNRYAGAAIFHYSSDYITLANRTELNQEYKYDPLYAGDLSEADTWIYGRVNDAYMNLHFKRFEFFLGRIKRNWGPVNSSSLVLSDFPYSYDHGLFSYTTKKLKLSLIFARLEDVPAVQANVGDNPDSLLYVSSARKFLVGHRLDLTLSSKIQIGFTEMATYGGPERDFDWSFLNPMTFYYALQRNDKKSNNGKWALDWFYKPMKKINFYWQFLIDDVIVNNDPGVDDRGRYPDRLALYTSVRTADLLKTGLNTDVSYTRVWNRTYQALMTWENYHYRGLGLGYPCAGCEELKVNLAYWGAFPFLIKNEFTYGRYGNVALTDYFPLKKEEFPVKPVIKNLANIFTLAYFASPRLQVVLKLENYKNNKHYLNRLNESSIYTYSLQVKYLLGKGMEVD